MEMGQHSRCPHSATASLARTDDDIEIEAFTRTFLDLVYLAMCNTLWFHHRHVGKVAAPMGSCQRLEGWSF